MEPDTIEAFARSGDTLARAIKGLTPEQLLWVPSPDAGVGLWSIQQVVIHLMDSDLIWTARLKQIIAEDNPRFLGYDESRFAQNLSCQTQSVEDAVTIFTLNRRNFAHVLRRLPPAAWNRAGQHSERGEVRLGPYFEMMRGHLSHHVEFIVRKRARQGIPG